MTDQPDRPDYDIVGLTTPGTQAAADQVQEWAVQQIRRGVSFILVAAPAGEEMTITTCLRLPPADVPNFYATVLAQLAAEGDEYEGRMADG